MAIILPVQCHENKSVDGDGSSHVDQVLNNTANKLFFIIIINNCLEKRVIQWELPFKKGKNHHLTRQNDLCAETRIPSCDFFRFMFVQTAQRKISLKGQSHKISERINFFESVFSGPKLFFNTTGDKYSTTSTLVTNAQLHWWQMPNYAGDKCSTTPVTNAQLHWWQMPNYAGDKCSTTPVTNTQLHWWQILNYTGDKCSTTLVTNAQLHWWQMLNYTGDKCSTTLVRNAQLHWWQMLKYTGKKLFAGVIFKRILCLPVALRVSMSLITHVSTVFLYICICHVACKYCTFRLAVPISF